MSIGIRYLNLRRTSSKATEPRRLHACIELKVIMRTDEKRG